MHRRKFIGGALPVMFAVSHAVSRAATPDTDARVDAEAKAIHARTLVLDSHVDILIPETPPQYRDKDGQSHASLAKLKAGGVGAVVFALSVGPGPRDEAGVKAARAEVDAKLAVLQQFVRDSQGAAVLADSAAAIEAAHKVGRIAVLPGFLNARSLGRNLSAIDEFQRKGVRVFGLTHAGHNDWADSSRPSGGPLSEHGGLSPLGRQAIQRLNDLGVLIDVSQLTQDGVQQVLQITRAPVIASHSAVRSLVENTRNLSDAEIDAIGRNGGVIHVPAFNSYLRRITPEVTAKLRAVRSEYGLPPDVAPGVSPNDGYPTLPGDRQAAFNAAVTAAIGRAAVSDLVDHIDYLVRRVGVDHVGIGTDFDHGSGLTGFASAADAGNVTRELVRRGYSEVRIQKIWSGNFLRALRAAEAARKS